MERHGCDRRRDGLALGHGHRAPTTAGSRAAAPTPPALSTSERMSSRPSSEPRMASTARLGCGISPATLPRAFDHAGDRPQRAVGVRAVAVGAGSPSSVDVAEEDLAGALQLVERRVVGEVAALAVRDGHPQRSPRAGTRCVNGVSRRSGAMATRRHTNRRPRCATARPARARPRPAPGSRCRSRARGRRRAAYADTARITGREPRDDARSQVVAVGEAAGQ